eukprot:8761057-Prorocentrum_lima.AAC.1
MLDVAKHIVTTRWMMVFLALDIDYEKLRYTAWLLPPLLTEPSVLYSPKHELQFRLSIIKLAI